jgi:hypothetical protein
VARAKEYSQRLDGSKTVACVRESLARLVQANLKTVARTARHGKRKNDILLCGLRCKKRKSDVGLLHVHVHVQRIELNNL